MYYGILPKAAIIIGPADEIPVLIVAELIGEDDIRASEAIWESGPDWKT